MFKCLECSCQFQDLSNLRRHRRSVHSREKPYTCKECGSQFSRSDHLKRHVVRHNIQRATLSCSVEGCRRTFVNEDACQLHRVAHQKKLDEDVIYIKGHLVKKSIKGNRTQFTCPYDNCQKLYVSYAGIARHIPWHLLHRQPLTADTRAQSSHSDAELYRCQVCKAAFKCKHNAVRHLVTVHGLPSAASGMVDNKCTGFACPFEKCGRIFTRSNNMRAHVRNVHEFQAPFTCDCCGATYKWKRSLARHNCPGANHDSKTDSQSSLTLPPDE
ncbi:zinc finger protein OZF, putative [Babesia caballi]|uniref:Zinc finger protein OZF, putative n=1 Tax=Babesia caballi TaxID=5871 RepID=A0AAV4LQF1_BABCB|nr:zinc finger protein OZF, putative [Babesia caballi]